MSVVGTLLMVRYVGHRESDVVPPPKPVFAGAPKPVVGAPNPDVAGFAPNPPPEPNPPVELVAKEE